MSENLAGLDTFPKLLMHHARVRPGRPAIREKLLEILPQCPALAHIYYDEPRGLRHYDQPQLMSCDKLVEIGRDSLRRDAAFLEAEVAKGAGSDTAAMFFTSGTTGAAKGVVLTH